MPVDLSWKYASTIAAGGTTSSVVTLNDAALVGLFIPDGWTAANLTMQVAGVDGSSWYDVVDAEGTPLTLVAVENQYIALPAGALHGIETMRFVSSETQVSDVSLVAAIRPFQ